MDYMGAAQLHILLNEHGITLVKAFNNKKYKIKTLTL